MSKKILTLLFSAFIFMLSGVLNVTAIEEKGRYYQSENIPIDITEYATNVFESLSANVLKNIGLDCNNVTINGVGQCWAASLGSTVEYLKDGYNSSVSKGREIRDNILKNYVTAYPENRIIKDYTGIDLKETNSMFSWDELKKQINNKIQLYTVLQRVNSTDTHAIVLCGYDCNYNNPSDTSDYRMYIMNPNYSSWQYAKYGTHYSTNIATYDGFVRGYYDD